jgi:ribosomal protein RSM22 (predicted rRNA methylase)
MLTQERDRLPAAYLKDPGLREAYCTYFLPPNARKISIPLAELALLPQTSLSKDRISVLDLGSGPGTALLGILEYFAARDKEPILRCTAVDQITENMESAEVLFTAKRISHGMSASLTTVKSSVEEAANRLSGTFDLIILSNVLNELFSRQGRNIEKRLVVLEDIITKLLARDGACIIIEPALRETSRELLLVRDGLIRQGFTIFAPCLCCPFCPALANPKDWCHEDVPWDAPEIIVELDRLTGLKKESLKFSYLTVRRDGHTLAEAMGEHAFRVVSEPLATKGKLDFYICGPAGRRLATRLDKDGTEINTAFGTLRRGDIVRFGQLIDEGKRYKIGKETEVALALKRS